MPAVIYSSSPSRKVPEMPNQAAAAKRRWDSVAKSKAVFSALLVSSRKEWYSPVWKRDCNFSNKNVITSGWPTARCKTVLPRNPQYKYDVENVFVDVWMCWCLIPRFSIVSKIRQISLTHADKRDDANFIKQLKHTYSPHQNDPDDFHPIFRLCQGKFLDLGEKWGFPPTLPSPWLRRVLRLVALWRI